MQNSVTEAARVIGPGYTEDEGQMRTSLAVFHHAIALLGWDDHVATHISARAPDNPDHMFLAPLGYMFREVTASSLMRVTLDGTKVDTAGNARLNRGAVVIHGGVYHARPDVNWVVHLHTTANVAVSAQRHGLLPISQYAMVLTGKLGYHPYEGIALDEDERTRLKDHLGDFPTLLLQNHGSLVCAAAADECFHYVYALERACEVQIAALAGGCQNLNLCDDAVSELTAKQIDAFSGFYDLAWEAMVRRVNSDMPGFDD